MSKLEFTFEQLEAFVRVAQVKNFARAGDLLGITQPAAWQRMARLEKLLGKAGGQLALIDRRSMSLTPRGQELLQLALELVQGGERFARIARGGPEPFTRLRLGVSETIAQTWLSRFIERLQRRYADLDLEIEVDISPQLGQRLLQQDLDLAFLLNPPKDATVESRFICHYPMSFFAKPDLVPAERPLPLAAISPFPILTFSRNTQPHLEMLQRMRDAGLPRPRIYACASLAPVVRMAKEGVGIALIPDEVVREDLRFGSLQRIEMDARAQINKLRFCASWLALGSPSTHGEMTRITELARSCANGLTTRKVPSSGGRSPTLRQARA